MKILFWMYRYQWKKSKTQSKSSKSCGPDGILTEHINYDGTNLKAWFGKIFNTIVEFESIPVCLNNAIITPIYKEKGKNPLSTKIYIATGVSHSSQSLENSSNEWLYSVSVFL